MTAPSCAALRRKRGGARVVCLCRCWLRALQSSGLPASAACLQKHTCRGSFAWPGTWAGLSSRPPQHQVSRTGGLRWPGDGCSRALSDPSPPALKVAAGPPLNLGDAQLNLPIPLLPLLPLCKPMQRRQQPRSAGGGTAPRPAAPPLGPRPPPRPPRQLKRAILAALRFWWRAS